MHGRLGWRSWMTFAGAAAIVAGVGMAACGQNASTDPPGTGQGAQETDGGELVARGRYLVDHLAACVDCHTPRLGDGGFDQTRYLSGVECLIGDAGAGGLYGGDGGVGCLNSRNLTNDPTGLANLTDEQIRNMFQHGVRPDGGVLVPVMPYWQYANLTDADARALVAYLRTVPGVNHVVPANQAPWNRVTMPAPAIDLNTVPAAPAGNEPAVRGRYLASVVSGCIDCHTPEVAPGSGQLDRSKWFAGSRVFSSVDLHLPSPPLPAIIYSANLTSDPTGLAGWTQADVVRAIKEGKTKNGENICPPMPAGPHGAFGGIVDSDAQDIGAFIVTLPPIPLMRPAVCHLP